MSEREPPWMTPDFEPSNLAEALYALACAAAGVAIGADHHPAWKHAQTAARMIEEARNGG